MLSLLLARIRSGLAKPSRAALALPIAVVLVGGLVLISLVLLVAAWEERKEQRAATTRLVSDALAVRATDLASRTRDYADRDTAPVGGAEWSDPVRVLADLETRLRRAAGVDLALVVGSDGRAVLAASDTRRDAAMPGVPRVEGLPALLGAARQADGDHSPAGFLRVNGMPMLVGAAVLAHPGADPTARPLLLLGQDLDPAFLAEFGRRYHLRALRLLAPDETAPPVALPLRLADGGMLGRLTWAVDSPLGRLLHLAAPVLLTTVMGLMVLALLVARQTRAAAARIAMTERLAFHDPLTGLPNRRLFLQRLDAALAERCAAALPVAVLYLDLDGFKSVNDSLGHVTGDRLLQVVAGRLLDSVRASDTVARLGGDEFAVLLPHPQRPEEAGEVARRLSASFAEPVLVEDRLIGLGVSTGAAVAPVDGVTAETLLREADSAMYRMKAARCQQPPHRPAPVVSMAA